MERRLIENGLLFFKYPFPQCKCNILEYETGTFIGTFFYCFLCLQLLKVFHLLHSGPTIPFEDGELPQDTCRARGKADIRYSTDRFEDVLQVNLETFVVPVGDPDMKLEWFLR